MVAALKPRSRPPQPHRATVHGHQVCSLSRAAGGAGAARGERSEPPPVALRRTEQSITAITWRYRTR
jgi:hypothetical protein